MPMTASMIPWIELGMLVRLETAPEWGVGQVQSVDGARVTVSFPHAGKRTLNLEQADLTVLSEDPGGEAELAD